MWWCPEMRTVLANEEVVDGKSEVGGFPVERRRLRQWVLRITAYADRLLAELESGSTGPRRSEMQQRNWIGRSEGAEVDFFARGPGARRPMRVFTTRPDTLFGVTYMVLAPEHPLVDALASPGQRGGRRGRTSQAAARKSDLERTERQGQDGRRHWAPPRVNPVNGAAGARLGRRLRLIATTARAPIMAVPGHDERDGAFARAYGLPIVQVNRRRQRRAIDVQAAAYVDEAWPCYGKTDADVPTAPERRRRASASRRGSSRGARAARRSPTGCATGSSRVSATGASRSPSISP